MANINAAAEEARSAVSSINRSATNLERPLNDFAATVLPHLQT